MKRYLILPLLFSLVYSCSKKDEPSDQTPTEPPLEVNNTWQCEIGDRLYQGSIDTSFYTISGSHVKDTVVTLTGSTTDGKANIALKIRINRTLSANSTVVLGVGGNYLTFDTASTNYLKTSEGVIIVPLTIEGFKDNKLKGSFSGELISLTGARQNITKGTISVELGKGNRTPKFLEMVVANEKVAGPIQSALYRYNTLVIDGSSFSGDTTYQLQIRTDGTIKPGVYSSRDGDVGFQLWRPSIFTHYVSDEIGDLAVTVESVNDDITTGRFEGVASTITRNESITAGRFRRKVKNYVASPSSVNQWGFSMDNNGQGPYVTAGGNIVSASVTQTAGRYVLTINGTTDHGRSIFYLKLNSFSPFKQSTYTIDSFFDSCYLSTPSAKYFNSNSRAYITIESLSSTHIVGGFYGEFVTGNELYGSGQRQIVRKGYFRTDGQF